jgi:hypothetical protein
MGDCWNYGLSKRVTGRGRLGHLSQPPAWCLARKMLVWTDAKYNYSTKVDYKRFISACLNRNYGVSVQKADILKKVVGQVLGLSRFDAFNLIADVMICSIFSSTGRVYRHA